MNLGNQFTLDYIGTMFNTMKLSTYTKGIKTLCNFGKKFLKDNLERIYTSLNIRSIVDIPYKTMCSSFVSACVKSRHGHFEVQ